MRESEFIIDSVNLLEYKLDRLNIVGTSVTSPKAVFSKILISEKKPIATFATLS